MSSRDFNQDVGRAKRAASRGPVLITDRGRPAHVLLSIDEFNRLSGIAGNIIDLIADEEAATIAFDLDRVSESTAKVPDLPD